MDALKIISDANLKSELPELNIGDTVRVFVKIKEGDRERVQAFEGIIIAEKHGRNRRNLYVQPCVSWRWC